MLEYCYESSCRPYGMPFYIGLVGPYAIIYIFNWAIFITIISSLLRKRKGMSGKSDLSKSKLKLRQLFIIALTLSLLFGLGWGIGFTITADIKHVPIATTLQALFIIFTSFQGLLIFFMHCVRSDDARNEWKKWFNVVTCHYSSDGYSSYKKPTHSSSAATGEYGYRNKLVSKGSKTLSTSDNYNSDTLKRAVKSPTSDVIEKHDLSLYPESATLPPLSEEREYNLEPCHEDMGIVKINRSAFEAEDLPSDLQPVDHFNILWVEKSVDTNTPLDPLLSSSMDAGEVIANMEIELDIHNVSDLGKESGVVETSLSEF